MSTKPIIVIDPGHGGRDPGATSGNLHEAVLVLDFAKLVAKAFEAVGCQVVMTRTTNTYVELDDRTKLERSVTAACIISIHMDWAVSQTARGVNVWLHSQAPERYIKWANETVAALRRVGYDDNRSSPVNKGYRDRPQGNYAINRDTRSPSMLLELGFVSNPRNAKDIVVKGQEYAHAIVAATSSFLKLPEPVQPPAADSYEVGQLRGENAALKQQLADEQVKRTKGVAWFLQKRMDKELLRYCR